jgi:hypothetical protein
MALVPATIASTILAQMNAQYGVVTGDALAERNKFCNALGTALTTILTAQMQVVVTATIASFGTPTPCVTVVS